MKYVLSWRTMKIKLGLCCGSWKRRNEKLTKVNIDDVLRNFFYYGNYFVLEITCIVIAKCMQSVKIRLHKRFIKTITVLTIQFFYAVWVPRRAFFSVIYPQFTSAGADPEITRKPSWRKGYARQRRHSKIAVSRHLGYYRSANSAVRSADPENLSLEPNVEWIGCTVSKIFAFKLYCDLEIAVWVTQGHRKWHYSMEHIRVRLYILLP